jgi:hypothetical protein
MIGFHSNVRLAPEYVDLPPLEYEQYEQER